MTTVRIIGTVNNQSLTIKTLVTNCSFLRVLRMVGVATRLDIFEEEHSWHEQVLIGETLRDTLEAVEVPPMRYPDVTIDLGRRLFYFVLNGRPEYFAFDQVMIATTDRILTPQQEYICELMDFLNASNEELAS